MMNIDDDALEMDEMDDIDDIDVDIDIDDIDDININDLDEEDNALNDEENIKTGIVSRHEVKGKHALSYDIIFKGKRDVVKEDEDTSTTFYNDNFELDKNSVAFFESYDNENYIRQKKVKDKIYKILEDKTDIKFLNNRRKPSKVDFNQHFALLINELKDERFTHVEIFNELSFYFSDNLFNMFKLLDNKYRTIIFNELQEHIGKSGKNTEIINRNLIEGTEIEFISHDVFGDTINVTGVIMETDYTNSIFTVNSYEKIHEVSIKNITKILSNTKFRNNLNKLNNIDFL